MKYNWAQALRRLARRRVRLAVAADDPRRLHVDAAAQLAQLSKVTLLPRSPEAKARDILRILR